MIFFFTYVATRLAEVEQTVVLVVVVVAVDVQLLLVLHCALCMAYKMGNILTKVGFGEAGIVFVKLQCARSHYWGHVVTVIQADNDYY